MVRPLDVQSTPVYRQRPQTPPDSFEHTPLEKSSPHEPSIWRKDILPILWMPKWCRWDPQNPPVFSTPMNVLLICHRRQLVADKPTPSQCPGECILVFRMKHHRTWTSCKRGVTDYFFMPSGDVFRRRLVLSMIFFTQ